MGKTKINTTLKIARDAAFNPLAFLGDGWRVVETDERAAKLSEVDFAKVNLETCLNGETWITGEEKLKRLKSGGNIRLDASCFLALWNEKGHRTLNWLYKERGVTCLDFFGTILESPCGFRCVLCLCRTDGGSWYCSSHALAFVWLVEYFSASLACKKYEEKK